MLNLANDVMMLLLQNHGNQKAKICHFNFSPPLLWAFVASLSSLKRIFELIACEQALSCGVGGWREEERELAIMSHKFEFCPQYPPQPLRG